MVNYFSTLTPRVTLYIDEDDIKNAKEVNSSLPSEQNVSNDTMLVPISSDNYFPNTVITAKPGESVDRGDSSSYEDMSSYTPTERDTSVEGMALPPVMPESIAKLRQQNESTPGSREALASLSPMLASFYLGKPSLDKLEQDSIEQEVVNSSPIIDRPTDRSTSLGFNWRKVLGDVLSKPIERETVNDFNTWVNNFGTSPFLGLLDSEHALQGFRQQANVNRDRDLKTIMQGMRSADAQMLKYFQSLGMTPEQAYNELINYKRESKSPLVQIGGDAGETTFQKELGKAFAGEIASARESYDARSQLTPYFNTLYSYLEMNPDVSWGKLLSGTVENFKQWFGFSDEQAQVARQAMRSVNALLRAENVKKVTGGGQVSNKEQEYLNYMLPGEDKTRSQNMYIVRNWKEINNRLNARLEEANRLLAMGADYPTIQRRWTEMQRADEEYFDSLYAEYVKLGRGSSAGGETGSYRVLGRVD